MKNQILELYFYEVEQNHLCFEAYPEYRQGMSQTLALWEDQELPAPVFRLLDTANSISFAHGLRLGLRLARWAEDGEKESLMPSAYAPDP